MPAARAKLPPTNPIPTLCEAAGISQHELGVRLGIGRQPVHGAVMRGPGISLAWLLRAAEAAGFEIEVHAVKRSKPKKGSSLRG